MTISGIITEYNPFHNGHLYHLEETRRITGCEGVICLMNGNFVQRGEPALLNKWARTAMALKNGVDLVIELPLIYGIRSAEYFARGSIALLNSTGIIDYIVFGSELGQIEPLQEAAAILTAEDPYYRRRLSSYLASGLPFPRARQEAVVDYLRINPDRFNLAEKELIETVSAPNNILGIEYLKALQQLNPARSPEPLTIKRKESAYHSELLRGRIASATAIRKAIFQDRFEEIKEFLPQTGWQIIKKEFSAGRGPLLTDHLDSLILARIRGMTAGELREFAEIGNGLENRILEAAYNSGNLEELLRKVKTKAFTWTRIQRNLLHILFDLKESDFSFMDKDGPRYLRILGFNKKGEELLALIKDHTSLPLIIQPADYLRHIDRKSSDPLVRSLSYDLLASEIYSLLYPAPSRRSGQPDFKSPPVKP